MQMKTGECMQFETISSDKVYEGVVVESTPIKTADFEGIEIDFQIEDYGAAKVLFPGETVTKESINYRAARSGIPSQFAGVRWPDFKWSYYGESMKGSRELAIARSFIANNQLFRERNKGLYIFGKIPGSGKTMLGCMLANEIIHKHIFSVKYTEQSKYLELMKSDEQAAKAEAKAIRDSIVLFLDDFGECNTSWQKECIFRLIENRQREGHITVYMSLFPPDRVKLDNNGKANDLINASALGLRLPDIPIRAQLAAKQSEDFERELLKLGT